MRPSTSSHSPIPPVPPLPLSSSFPSPPASSSTPLAARPDPLSLPFDPLFTGNATQTLVTLPTQPRRRARSGTMAVRRPPTSAMNQLTGSRFGGRVNQEVGNVVGASTSSNGAPDSSASAQSEASFVEEAGERTPTANRARTTPATEPLRADEQELDRRAQAEHMDAVQALALRQLDRERSLSRASQSGACGKRVKKWLVLVVPPDVLPHSPPPAPTSGFANGYGPSGRYSDGILLPLQPTLSAQFSLIAREFSLPSIAGICVYLCLPSDQSAPATWPISPNSSRYPFPSSASLSGGQDLASATKPRLTEESWSILWAEYLDGDGHVEGNLGMGGLPIAGRLEFDIDPRRARWLPAWCALPAATPNTYPAIRPRSPAFEHAAGQRPRFGTSLSYARSSTPASSDAYAGHIRSATESQEGGGEDDDGSTAEDGTVHYPAPRFHPPTSPQMSTPRSGFHSPRPLSLLSQGSSIFRDAPSPGAMSDLRLPGPLSSRPPSRSKRVPPSQLAESPSQVKPTFYDDSGFAESASFATASLRGETGTPVKTEDRSTGVSGSTFAFPRPDPRGVAVSSLSEGAGARSVGEADTTMEWTVQLDHLREFSETSLMEGVDVADAEGAGSSALGDLLLGFTQEEGADKTVKIVHESPLHSPIYPPTGLHGIDQPHTLFPPSSSASPLLPHPHSIPASPTPRSASPHPAPANFKPLPPSTQRAPRSPSNLATHPHPHLLNFVGPKRVDLVDVSPRIARDLSPTLPSQYPWLQIYPSVYPTLIPYPSMPPGAAILTPEARNNKPSPLPLSVRAPSVHGITGSRSTIPPSPKRLPSPSLRDRFSYSAEVGDFKAKQFGGLEIDDEVEKASAREETYGRKSLPVENDWKILETGTRSSKDASELTPDEDEQEDEKAEDDYDEERSSFDDDSDSEDDNDDIYAAYQGTALSAIAEETESQGLTTQHGTPSSASFFGLIEDGKNGDEQEHTVEHEKCELTGAVAMEGPLARPAAAAGSAKVVADEQLHVDAEAPPDEESLQIPSVEVAPAPDTPQITYFPATASPSPSTHRSSPPTLERKTSPLPSPTITPSSAFSAVSAPAEPTDEVTAEPAQAEAIEDYSFELDTTGTARQGESGEIPYIASPGLQRALGLDDSPELHPVWFPVDDFESDDSQSDDGSQYVLHAPSDTGANSDGDQVVEMEDGECQTFDHLSPLPLPTIAPPPVLFSFSNTHNLQEVADAMNTFVIEAQTQSIERRGKFIVALSGGDLPQLLAQALVADDRVEWDKWDIFFTDEALVPLDHPDSTCKAYTDHLFSKTSIPSSRIHAINAAELAGPGPVSTQVAERIAVDYEGELLQAFPDLEGPGRAPGPPRFDMVLLGIGEDGHTASLFPSHPTLVETKWWVSPVLDAPPVTVTATPIPTSRITLTYPVLSSARRLAFLCVGATKRDALANVLDVDIPRERDDKVPAGRIALAGHPVVVFADDEAVAGLRYPTTRFWEEG